MGQPNVEWVCYRIWEVITLPPAFIRFTYYIYSIIDKRIVLQKWKCVLNYFSKVTLEGKKVSFLVVKLTVVRQEETRAKY